MYPSDATHDSDAQAQAQEPERRQMGQADARYGFRPLALPALAAAAKPTRPAAKAGPRAGLQGVLAIVHEDAPLD